MWSRKALIEDITAKPSPNVDDIKEKEKFSCNYSFCVCLQIKDQQDDRVTNKHNKNNFTNANQHSAMKGKGQQKNTKGS